MSEARTSRGDLPSSIPDGQEYYWKPDWQENVRKHYEERAAGKIVEFENAADLIKWLQEGEDDA